MPKAGHTIALAMLLGLAACTSNTSGAPLPATFGPSNPPSSIEDTSTKLASMDPCALLSERQLEQLGLTKRKADSAAGARSCSWTHKTDQQGKGGFVVGADIRERQGLKDVNSTGYSVTDDQIGRHAVRQAEEVPDGGICIIAIGVSESSRVDVVVAAESGRACAVANPYAKLIEPLLPGGRS